jgi:UDP-glucose 4-epimerase
VSPDNVSAQRLLVTGANGFVGSAVSRRAMTLGWDVTGMVRSRSNPPSGVTYVRSPDGVDALAAFIREFDPSVVIHAGGPASVADSLYSPAEDFRGSVVGWQLLLESLRRSDARAIAIYLSSAAVYGQPRLLPVTESAALDPISPYGFHKLMCENLSAEYSKCFGLRTLNARLFSVLGPAQRRLLAWELGSQALGPSAEIRVRGTGSETRDFLHVDDAAEALLGLSQVLHSATDGECWTVNLASGVEVSVAEIARSLKEVSGCGKPIVYEGRESPGNPVRWSADISLLNSLLPQWRPRPLGESISDCLLGWSRPEMVAMSPGSNDTTSIGSGSSRWP